jgi:hypothetical protein
MDKTEKQCNSEHTYCQLNVIRKQNAFIGKMPLNVVRRWSTYIGVVEKHHIEHVLELVGWLHNPPSLYSWGKMSDTYLISLKVSLEMSAKT